MIPEEVIEQISDRVDLVELIGAYVPLKRAGRRFKALCPFHQEKTPSFTVNPEKGIYHCFGCGVSGNAFKFLMEFERMDFPEAVRALGERVGVDVPTDTATQRHDHSRDRLRQANEIAARFYQQQLFDTREGAGVQTYLESRSIAEATARAYGIGYAPEGWDALLRHAVKSGCTSEQLVRAGLVVSREDGRQYDRFRGRLMFPIRDVRGRVVGFGGRRLKETSERGAELPKYVNTPETELYRKGQHLYGLDQARQSLRETDVAVIVEGYLDCLIPAQAGFSSIVAALGTALTPEQIQLLRRFVSRVVIMFDADQAGEDATLRSLVLCLEAGMQVALATLPVGEDPDTYVRSAGVDAFRRLTQDAEDLVDYTLRVACQRFDMHRPEGLGRISDMVLSTLCRIPSSVVQSAYVRRIAESLKVPESALREELSRIRQNTPSPRRPLTVRPQSLEVPSAERMLIGLMIDVPACIEVVRQHLDPGEFSTPQSRVLIKTLYRFHDEGTGISINRLMTALPQDDIHRLLIQAGEEAETLDEPQRALVDCIKWMKRSQLDVTLAQLRQQIKQAQSAKEDTTVLSLSAEYTQLLKQYQTLQ